MFLPPAPEKLLEGVSSTGWGDVPMWPLQAVPRQEQKDVAFENCCGQVSVQKDLGDHEESVYITMVNVLSHFSPELG